MFSKCFYIVSENGKLPRFFIYRWQKLQRGRNEKNSSEAQTKTDKHSRHPKKRGETRGEHSNSSQTEAHM